MYLVIHCFQPITRGLNCITVDHGVKERLNDPLLDNGLSIFHPSNTVVDLQRIGNDVNVMVAKSVTERRIQALTYPVGDGVQSLCHQMLVR